RGGSFARNREALVQQEATLKQRVSLLEDTIRHNCAGILPFAVVPGLSERLGRQLVAEETLAQDRAGRMRLSKAKDELAERLKPSKLFSNIDEVPNAAQDQISSRINSALRDSLEAAEPEPTVAVHNLSNADSRLLSLWIAEATIELPKTLRTVYDELE